MHDIVTSLSLLIVVSVHFCCIEFLFQCGDFSSHDFCLLQVVGSRHPHNTVKAVFKALSEVSHDVVVPPYGVIDFIKV